MIQFKLTMKRFFSSLLIITVLLMACSEHEKKSTTTNTDTIYSKIPQVLVKKSDLKYNHKTSIWTMDDYPFSGFAVSYYPNKSLKEKFGILNGRKQNNFIQWYRDGHFKNTSVYNKGRLHGTKKLWSSDSTHMLIAHYNYQKGKPHGEQKKWYVTGELFKKMNLNKGKEEGLQQAFRKNGALYANYEAKSGRIFGLKRGQLCYSLENEKIQYK